jgi:hypothetical protein
MLSRFTVAPLVLLFVFVAGSWAADSSKDEKPLPEGLAKAQKAVSDELTKENINGGRVNPVQNDAVAKVVTDYQFVAVVFSPYPVARPTPKGFSQGNIYAASKDGTLKLFNSADELQKFFASNAAPAKDEKTAKDVLAAWLRLTQEFSQDGFFEFGVDAESLKVEKEKDGLKAIGTNAVVQKNRDSGEIKATLTFDKDGKLTKVDEERNVKAGIRPKVLER